MSIKNIRTVIIILLLMGCVAGCQSISFSLKAGGGRPATDEIYNDLKYLISYPDRLERLGYQEYLGKKITFTAIVLSDPENLEFDDEEGQRYISAAIVRNRDQEFLLNTNGIDKEFAVGDIIQISGSIEGYIYHIVDHENVKILDIKASAITRKEPEDNPDTQNKITITNSNGTGSFVFKEAQLTKDSFRDVVLLYFEFINEDSNEIAPPVNRLIFAQGDYYLSASIFNVDAELNPSALKGGSITDPTLPGKTFLYYIVLAPEDVNIGAGDGPIEVYYHDDDFNCLNMVEVPVEIME